MPAHFLVCRACARDLASTPGGWELRRAVWTAEGMAAASLPQRTAGKALAAMLAEVPEVIRARLAVLSFLKLHSSAL
jgi:hypothetical protein